MRKRIEELFGEAKEWMGLRRAKFRRQKFVREQVLVTAFSCTSAFAQIEPCEELKAEIEAKLKAKGVEGYTLEIIPANQVKDQKIIGSCEGGTKKISYSRAKGK